MAVSPSTEPPKKRSSSILGSLREAIKKVRFLLSSSATRWMLLFSIARGGGRATPRRGISFNSPRPGLLDVEGSIVSPSPASSRTTSRSASMGTATTRSVSRTSSARTSSGGSPSSSAGDDDIDRRAEQFIANFYRQLQMERQVSLQLRYIRGNSWERTP